MLFNKKTLYFVSFMHVFVYNISLNGAIKADKTLAPVDKINPKLELVDKINKKLNDYCTYHLPRKINYITNILKHLFPEHSDNDHKMINDKFNDFCIRSDLDPKEFFKLVENNCADLKKKHELHKHSREDINDFLFQYLLTGATHSTVEFRMNNDVSECIQYHYIGNTSSKIERFILQNIPEAKITEFTIGTTDNPNGKTLKNNDVLDFSYNKVFGINNTTSNGFVFDFMNFFRYFTIKNLFNVHTPSQLINQNEIIKCFFRGLIPQILNFIKNECNMLKHDCNLDDEIRKINETIGSKIVDLLYEDISEYKDLNKKKVLEELKEKALEENQEKENNEENQEKEIRRQQQQKEIETRITIKEMLLENFSIKEKEKPEPNLVLFSIIMERIKLMFKALISRLY